MAMVLFSTQGFWGLRIHLVFLILGELLLWSWEGSKGSIQEAA